MEARAAGTRTDSAPVAGPGPSGAVPSVMRAARLDTAAGRLVVRDDVPVPVPGPGEALVKVAVCGICHSDLGQIEGRSEPRLAEVTPGHEAAGYVSALGPGVSHWAVGDRVVIMAGRRCGACRTCHTGGSVDDCERMELMSFAYDGAWAEYTRVPAASLVAVPESVPIEQAAVLADAVSTPYGAVSAAGIRPAQAVGVWGVGGLGTHLVQLLRLCGAAPIIALDPLPSARERALKLGADVALDPKDEDVARRIARETGGSGLSVAFECVGRAAIARQALAALGTHGRLVLVGVSRDTLELGTQAALVLRQQQIAGHLGYRTSHLRDLVELVARGRLDLSASISAILPLEQVEEGVRRLREHDGDPVRILIRP